jgi:hypothetical protein
MGIKIRRPAEHFGSDLVFLERSGMFQRVLGQVLEHAAESL